MRCIRGINGYDLDNELSNVYGSVYHNPVLSVKSVIFDGFYVLLCSIRLKKKAVSVNHINEG